MRSLLFLSILAIACSAFAHDTNECNELEATALQIVNKMNSLFGTDIKIKFIESANTGPKVQGEKEVPLSLSDANAAHKEMQLPKPCLLKDSKLPSKEHWSLIIAHEFSHYIIDQRQERCTAEFERSRTLSEEDRRELSHMHHANNDVLGLKILRTLKVDARKGIWELGDYVKQNRKAMGDDAANAYEKRVAYMKQIWPTNFSSSDDFLFAEYFDGFDQLKNYFAKRTSESNFIQGLKNGTDSLNGCFIVKSSKAQESLKVWRSLGTALLPAGSSKRSGAK